LPGKVVRQQHNVNGQLTKFTAAFVCDEYLPIGRT